MTRNEMLQWFILGFGLSAQDRDLGRPTNMAELWREAKASCFDCDWNEVLDALYTLPREQAALIKFLTVGEGYHPVSFERVRNTNDWPAYFSTGQFNVKVLPEGRVHYQKFSKQLEKTVSA